MEHLMPDSVMLAIQYGGYVSIIKFVVFLTLFLLWLLLLNWVYQDAKAVETNAAYWAGIIFGAGAAAIIIWMIVPHLHNRDGALHIAVGQQDWLT